jgi:hypothetical protein
MGEVDLSDQKLEPYPTEKKRGTKMVHTGIQKNFECNSVHCIHNVKLIIGKDSSSKI